MTIPMSRRDVVAPGPRGSLLLGLARDLQRDPLATFDRAAATYGDVVRLTAGPPGRREPWCWSCTTETSPPPRSGRPDRWNDCRPTTRRP